MLDCILDHHFHVKFCISQRFGVSLRSAVIEMCLWCEGCLCVVIEGCLCVVSEGCLSVV